MKVASLKKARDGDNIEEIKNKTSELSQAIQKVGAKMYQRAQEKKEEKDPETEKGEYKEK